MIMFFYDINIYLFVLKYIFGFYKCVNFLYCVFANSSPYSIVELKRDEQYRLTLTAGGNSIALLM